MKKQFFFRTTGMFRRIGVVVATVMTIALSLIAQTNVSGTISSNTIWNVEGSPYIVVGNVVVDTLITLTIQPGVEVRLDSAKCIMVKGNLTANGTVGDSIVFTKNGESQWARLWLKPSAKCSFKYCRIEYATSSAICNNEEANSLQVLQWSLFVDSCTITKNDATESNSTGSAGAGIYICSPSTITNNTITCNSAEYGSIYAYQGYQWSGITTKIANNNISNNSGIGIYACGGTVISHNTVSNNSGAGITCTTDTILNNTIFNNTNGGIQGSHSFICNNTIYDNSTAGKGGGISALGCKIINNSILNNRALDGCGAIYCYFGPDAESSFLIRYNTIVDTTAIAIGINNAYTNDGSIIRTNNISATGYFVREYNGTSIDARYNYWYTINDTAIDAKLFDYYEDFTMGFINYRPILTSAFNDTTAPSAPVNLLAHAINDSTFEVSWTNPNDSSGISEYYYNYYWPAPSSNFDTTGTFHSSPDTITITGGLYDSLYLWLVDGSGNLNFENRAVIYVDSATSETKKQNTSLAHSNIQLEVYEKVSQNTQLIRYFIPCSGKTMLAVYDISGKKIRQLVQNEQKSGAHEFIFVNDGLSTGSYLLVLEAGHHTVMKKLTVLR